MFKKKQNLIMILVLGLILQLFFVSSTSADFKAQAFATSNNLLLGKSASSITNFHYNIISLPGNSSVKVQFSQNNSTWYSAAGVSGAWETLTGTGVGDISLTSLAWSGASFYYKFQLNATSDQSQTPVIGDIRLDFKDEDSDQVFVFDNSGNVGIGLTNPSQKLDVAGKIALDGTTIAYLPTAFTGTLILGDGGTNLQTGADYNTFVGLGAGVNNTTGSNNTANGYQALYGNTTGSNNTANGYSAGRYIANGGANQTGSNSLFLGADTRAKANGETNQIVIGYGAIGNGSNTVTIGNSSILKHIFESGYVGIGTTSPAVKLHIVGGTGNVLNVNGGRITGLNDTPDADSEAVPLGFLQANYSSTTAMIAASLWSGAKNGNIWNGDSGAGNVGIGTTNPVSVLHILGTGATNWTGNGTSTGVVTIGPQGASGSSLFVNTPSQNTSYASGLGVDGSYASQLSIINLKALGVNFAGYSSNLAFSVTNGTSLTEAMRINNIGNVGINTTTPAVKLHIAGGTGNVLNVNGGRIIGLNDTPNSDDEAVPLGFLQANYSSTTAMIAASLWSGAKNGNIWNGDSGTGNVGIGTTNPVAKLTLQQGDQAYAPLWASSLAEMALGISANTSKISGLDFKNFNSAGQVRLMARNDADNYIVMNAMGTTATASFFGQAGNQLTIFSVGKRFSLGTNDSQPLILGTSNTERMRILSNGNVGINTTTPAVKLHIVGGTGNVLNVNGGRIIGLNDTPNSDDEAVPYKFFKDYLQANYSSTSTASNMVTWGGNTLGIKKTLGSNDNYDIGFITNNTERLTILKDGKVGIGTTTPTQKLDVSGNIALSGNIIDTDSSVGNADVNISGTTISRYIRFITSSGAQKIQGYGNVTNSLRLGAGDSDDITITAGNVGISTSTPAVKLHITGGTGNVLNVGGGRIIGLNDTPNSDDEAVPLGFLQANYSSTTAMIAASLWSGAKNGNIWNGDSGAGNVGIGTTNPVSVLHILGTGATNWTGNGTSTGVVTIGPQGASGSSLFVNTPSQNTSYASGLGVDGSYASQLSIINLKALGVNFAGYSSNLAFSVTNGTSLTEAMRINNIGNVGINTTTPAVKLHIAGGTGNVLNVNGGRIIGLNDTPNSDDEAVPLGFLQANYSSTTAMIAASLWSGAKNGNIWNGDSGVGNVGIGTTAPSNKLEIGNLGADGSDGIKLSRNTGYGWGSILVERNTANTISSGGDSLVFSSRAAKINMQDQWVADGTYSNIRFYTADKGAASVLTERMAILYNGNVGIGTTAPNYPLEVLKTTADTDVTQLTLKNSDNGVGAGASIGFSPITTNILTGKISNIRDAGGEYSLRFYNYGAGGNAERMRINYLGNVGINTTTPAVKLHIVGGTGNALNVGGGRIIGLNDTPNSDDEAVPYKFFKDYLQANYSSTSTASNMVTWGGNTLGSKKLIGSIDNYDIGLKTNNLERLTILKDGNVGIGTTSPVYELSVNGRIQSETSYYLGNRIAIYFPGTASVAVGTGAQGVNAYRNMSLGWDSGAGTTGDNRVEIGFYSGRTAAGSRGVFIGSFAGNNATAEKAVFVGYGAGNESSSTNSIGLGYLALRSSSSANNIAIGYEAGKDSNVDNQFIVQQSNINVIPLIQGDFSSGNVGISTSTPAVKLHIAGGTGNVLNVGGGRIIGLNDLPSLDDEAVPLKYLNDNFSPKYKMHKAVNDVDYTATDADYVIGYTAITANRIVTLPNAVCEPGRFFVILDESGNAGPGRTISIQPETGSTIIGQASFNLVGPYNSINVICGSASGGNKAWFIL